MFENPRKLGVFETKKSDEIIISLDMILMRNLTDKAI